MAFPSLTGSTLLTASLKSPADATDEKRRPVACAMVWMAGGAPSRAAARPEDIECSDVLSVVPAVVTLQPEAAEEPLDL